MKSEDQKNRLAGLGIETRSDFMPETLWQFLKSEYAEHKKYFICGIFVIVVLAIIAFFVLHHSPYTLVPIEIFILFFLPFLVAFLLYFRNIVIIPAYESREILKQNLEPMFFKLMLSVFNEGNIELQNSLNILDKQLAFGRSITNATPVKIMQLDAIKEVLIHTTSDKQGPLHVLHAVDTSPPILWISNGILQYDSVLSLWSRKRLFEMTRPENMLDLIGTNQAKFDFVWPSPNKLGWPYPLVFSDRNDRIGVHLPGRIERIFIWALDDIRELFGAHIIAYHYMRGNKVRIIPKEDYSNRDLLNKVRDFVFWDCHSATCQPACHPGDERNSCIGYEMASGARKSTIINGQKETNIDIDFIDPSRRNEVLDVWSALHSASIGVDEIVRISNLKFTSPMTIAEQISSYHYEEHFRL